MVQVWIYAFVSVFLISLASLVGVFTLSFKKERLKRLQLYLVSFAAGALFGDAFIHLLPEAAEQLGLGLQLSLSVLLGIGVWFIIEKIIHWRHCHFPNAQGHSHPFAYMNLIGDGVHNFIDGLIIGASFLVSIPVGIATSVAVLLHEIPQEIGDFGVLVHGGFSVKKALLSNFFISLTSFLGLIIALLIGNAAEGFTYLLLPFAAGGFIYIAGSDLIPELHKEVKVSKSIKQFLFFSLGILLMMALLLIG